DPTTHIQDPVGRNVFEERAHGPCFAGPTITHERKRAVGHLLTPRECATVGAPGRLLPLALGGEAIGQQRILLRAPAAELARGAGADAIHGEAVAPRRIEVARGLVAGAARGTCLVEAAREP